jgi:hypothetical protein
MKTGLEKILRVRVTDLFICEPDLDKSEGTKA